MKKFVSGMLAAAMALSLAACSSSGSSSAADDSSSAATTEESSTAESTGTPIHLGGIGPLTGDNAAYGIAVSNGAELAVNEINAAAGTEVFTLDFQDDESDSEKAVNAFNTLLDGGMQILVGPVTSNPSIRRSARVCQREYLYADPFRFSVDVVTAGEGNAFQMCFTDPNQGLTAADYIADNSLGTAIGIIYDSSDAYSTGIYTAFAEEASARGLNVVATSTFTSDNNTDLSTQVQQCQQPVLESGLPAHLLSAGQPCPDRRQQHRLCAHLLWLRRHGTASWALTGFDTSPGQRPDAAVPLLRLREDETTTTFVSAYEAAYGETPNQFAADAYDCVYAIYQCVGGTAPTLRICPPRICAMR